MALRAANLSYDRTSLALAAGKAVTFTLTNADTVKHNLTIPALNVNTDADPGKSGTATATPKAGTSMSTTAVPPHEDEGDHHRSVSGVLRVRACTCSA